VYSAYYKLLMAMRSGMPPTGLSTSGMVTALWLVLISRPAEGRRLIWLGWLGEILRWFAHLKTVTHPSICRGGWELNPRPSSREFNAPTTRLPSHQSLRFSVC